MMTYRFKSKLPDPDKSKQAPLSKAEIEQRLTWIAVNTGTAVIALAVIAAFLILMERV